MLTSTGTVQAAHWGAYCSMTAWTPTFCRPIELSIPAAVSTVRGGGLPARGCKVVPLQTMAPRALDVHQPGELDAVAKRAARGQDGVPE